MKYLNASLPWPYSEDGALVYYRDIALPAMARGDEWHWTLRSRTSPRFVIGGIALGRGEWINRGFWLRPAWQGKGLMTEAVIVTNDYWFNVLGFKVLRAPKAIANVSSRRVSEKTGMRVIAMQEHDYVSGRHSTEIWEITAEEWQQKRALLLSHSKQR